MIPDEKSGWTDKELTRLAATGDAAAFEEIHRRYRRLVYAVALRMTGNSADAEDLTQESFVSVLRKIGSFRGEAAFSSWLYRLTVNQVNMHFRRLRSRPEEQTSDGELPERGASFERDLDSRQVIDRLAIEKAVRRLPPGYRAAFILYDVAGYEHKEIGQMMGRSVGTSKSQLHMARLSLQKLLTAQSPVPQS